MKNILGYFVFAYVLLSFMGCGTTSDNTSSDKAKVISKFTLKGLVEDSVTKQPISGVEVSIKAESKNKITNNTGRYEISDISLTSFILTASKSGYWLYNRDINMDRDTNITTRIIKLQPVEIKTISGIIKDSNSTNPIYEAEIIIGKKNTKTDKDGFYQIPMSDIPLGNQKITVSHNNYRKYAGIVLIGSKNIIKDVILKPSHSIPLKFISKSIVSVYENQRTAITLKASSGMDNVVYSIEGNDSNSFNIDKVSGIVSFKVDPDYEIKKVYGFTAIATNNSRNVITQQVTIFINNIVSETKPVFNNVPVSVKENQFKAIDLNATSKVKISNYQIDKNDSASFTVNNLSGVVLFIKAPDYETKKKYTFEAKATDTLGNVATTAIVINILDVNETWNIGNLNTAQIKSYHMFDDGKYKKGKMANFTRDSAKNTVLDKNTKLMWLDNGNSKDMTLDFNNANLYCANITQDYNDWKLPTLMELNTIISHKIKVDGISLDQSFQNINSDNYWSSNTYRLNMNNAWLISFRSGETRTQSKWQSAKVRCVRDTK